MKGFKTRLELNNRQTTMALQHAGVARHAWNWCVSYCREKSAKREKLPSAIDLHKLLVKEVKTSNPWYYQSSKCAPQNKTRDIQTAYTKFFQDLKSGKVQKLKSTYIAKRKSRKLPINYDIVNEIGKPQFKRKNAASDTFYLEGAIQTDKNKIKVPKFGWLKCSEQLPDCEIKNVVISRQADEWFISFKVPLIPQIIEKKGGAVGVDLGVKTLATLSDGTIFPAIKPYRRHKRKLRRLQRVQSKRFVKGAKNQSYNYKKASEKVAKLHQKIANVRNNYTHKLTTYLTKNHSEIVIEDLNVAGMSKNHKMASAILDGGFSEFRRQVEYKCKWYGSILTVVDRFYPSSKTCSCCEKVKKTLKLSERVYRCDSCGTSIDRDLNAAINLKKKAESSPV